MIEGIDHIGIAVRSIDEARPLYAALGLEIAEIEEVPSEKVRVAMISCGAVRLELLEPTAPDSPIATFLEKRGPGIHHVCLRSGDILEDDQRLRKAGLRLLRDEPSPGAEGSTVQFIHPKSAGGMLLELAQPAER